MENPKKSNIDLQKEYWEQADKLNNLAEKKNILEAIKKTDTEKFYLFTRMLRIANTLQKAKFS